MKLTVKQLKKTVEEQGVDAFASVELCCENGWYDWFCSDSSLKNRTKKFFPILKGIKEGGKVDFDWESWFKNNCSCAYDGTYDQIRFSSYDENGEWQSNELVIGYREPWHDAVWTVYMPSNDFNEPVAMFNDVRNLVKWLNEKGE